MLLLVRLLIHHSISGAGERSLASFIGRRWGSPCTERVRVAGYEIGRSDAYQPGQTGAGNVAIALWKTAAPDDPDAWAVPADRTVLESRIRQGVVATFSEAIGPADSRLAQRQTAPGLEEENESSERSSDTRSASAIGSAAWLSEAAFPHAGSGGAPLRTMKRRIQSRTVVAGNARSRLMGRYPCPAADAVSAAPMTSTRSSRRSSVRSGRIT